MPEESKLTNKQRLFLDALISEEAMGDLRTAMRLAGYSDNTKVAHTAKELRDEIREATETLLAMYAPKAAHALTSVLDNPDALNARHVISAAKEILDRTGLVKKERVEVTGSAGGFLFCRLRDQLMARSETGGTKQELDPDTPLENLKIVNQKYAYNPDPNKLRTPDGQIVDFVVA